MSTEAIAVLALLGVLFLFNLAITLASGFHVLTWALYVIVILAVGYRWREHQRTRRA